MAARRMQICRSIVAIQVHKYANDPCHLWSYTSRNSPNFYAMYILQNLARNTSWARDVNGRDRDETLIRLETESETTTLTDTQTHRHTSTHHNILRPWLPSACRDELNSWHLAWQVLMSVIIIIFFSNVIIKQCIQSAGNV